jgi:hypothetical protein
MRDILHVASDGPYSDGPYDRSGGYVGLTIRLLTGAPIMEGHRQFLFQELHESILKRSHGDKLSRDDMEFLAFMVRLAEKMRPGGQREAFVNAVCTRYQVSRAKVFVALKENHFRMAALAEAAELLERSGWDLQGLGLQV